MGGKSKKQERRKTLKRGVLLLMRRDISTQCPITSTEVPPAQAGEVSCQVRLSETGMILEG